MRSSRECPLPFDTIPLPLFPRTLSFVATVFRGQNFLLSTSDTPLSVPMDRVFSLYLPFSTPPLVDSQAPFSFYNPEPFLSEHFLFSQIRFLIWSRPVVFSFSTDSSFLPSLCAPPSENVNATFDSFFFSPTPKSFILLRQDIVLEQLSPPPKFLVSQGEYLAFHQLPRHTFQLFNFLLFEDKYI